MKTYLNRKKSKHTFLRIILFFSFILILYLLSIINSFASEVDSLKAKQVGENFIQPLLKNQTNLKSISISEINLKLSKTIYTEGRPSFYIFNFVQGKGFVIIAAEDAVDPVLGYSFEYSYNDEDQKPDGFTYLLSGYSRQIEKARKDNTSANKSVKVLWEKYSENTEQTEELGHPQHSSFADIAPLLTTKWNQGCGYNDLCPADAKGPCGRTWAGCVAVSEAQVMKFWNYPVTGEGSHSYTTKYGTHSVDFESTTYNWAGMPNGSGSEVAKLLYHVGVAVNMNYGPSGSGAYMSSTANSVISYFKYSTNALCTYKSGYTDTNWQLLLNRELTEGRPLMYAGGSHAFVLDGFQNENYFHVNWGWGGSYDGYFYLNNLKPGSYDFTSSQCAIIGVMPKTLYKDIDTLKIIPVTCGLTYNDSTTNGENKINKYGNTYLPYTGKEKIYSLVTSFPGRIKATISGLNGKKLKLILLKDANKDSLLAYGDSSVYFDTPNTGKYYISVDGSYGDEGSYNLKVNCPTLDPDLIFTSTQVIPYNIQTNQTNVNLKCTIKNIGNSIANSSKLLFYYSEDQTLNAGDIRIDSVSVSDIASGSSIEINKNVNMPAMISGSRYILFVADADNNVIETDETDNIMISYIQVVPEGIMNCA